MLLTIPKYPYAWEVKDCYFTLLLTLPVEYNRAYFISFCVHRNPEWTACGQQENHKSAVWIDNAMLYPDLNAIPFWFIAKKTQNGRGPKPVLSTPDYGNTCHQGKLQLSYCGCAWSWGVSLWHLTMHCHSIVQSLEHLKKKDLSLSGFIWKENSFKRGMELEWFS